MRADRSSLVRPGGSRVSVDVARRLPGIRFEAVPPPSPRVLPRMDVAAFVGFATGGPFDLPVPIEDPAQFAATFGSDLELAVDPLTNEAVYTQLGSAVRTFLRNGGKRCWVARVGAQAGTTTTFLIPGLLALDDRGLAPATMQARSPGTWADDVTVATALESVPAQLLGSDGSTFDVRLPGSKSIQSGDLLRFSGEGWSVLAPAIVPGPQAPGLAPAPAPAAGAMRVGFDGSRAVWIEPVDRDSLPSPPFDADQSPPTGAAVSARLTTRTGAYLIEQTATLTGLDAHARLVVQLALDPQLAPPEGSLVTLSGAGFRHLWLSVDAFKPANGGIELTGAAWWVSTNLPQGALPATMVEKLTLELWARAPGRADARLDGLTFAPEHPRFVGNLPSDEEFWRAAAADPPATPPALSAQARAVDMPLCGAGTIGAAPTTTPTLFPLAIGVVPAAFLDAAVPDGDPYARNGLNGPLSVGAHGELELNGYLDPDLADTHLRALAASADFIRYQAPEPRRLRGIHAALELDEVTLISVPDATQRQWQPQLRPPLPEVTAPRELPHPTPGEFARCGLRALQPAPTLEATPPDASGRATLSWTATDAADADYLVQASSDPSAFAGAVTVYDGPEQSVTVDAVTTGPFFRVRAHSPAGDSDWSNAIGIDAGPPSLNLITDGFRAEPLLAIQRALLRMCAARGDIFAVLSLPSHYREDDALQHVAALRPPDTPVAPVWTPVEPLDYSEALALTEGAIYHPWPLVQLGTGAPLQRIPPDGPAVGALAQRASTRGAWVAAANEPLNDVVGLEPKISRSRLANLQAGQLNVLRQEPAGFVCLDEDTLSLDQDVRPINVRRLLHLLRRLALLYGPQYAFEPNDERLRRRIQRGFEAILRELYRLGAFRGATPAEAFQVVTGNPPNISQSVEEGRLIVELRVAPSVPMRFITVRLLQGAAGGVEAQEA